MSAACRSRYARGLRIGAAVLVGMLLLDGAMARLWAETPFGGPRPASALSPGGLAGWILARQSEFYREISSTIRAAKSDGSAVYTLLLISFAYGIFHAAGPGHGKAVISSYLVANQETARRGIVLSFASALLQSLVAVALVGISAVLLNATARSLCGAEKTIEIASYALIAAFGARLVWTKGGGFIAALQMRRKVSAIAESPRHQPRHGHPQAGHDHVQHHEPSCDHDHVHGAACGHAHGPTPEELAGPGGLRRGLGAILAVGLRPCSGAILVLVFALAQGLFWVGIAATLVMGLGTAITVAAIALLAISAKGLALRLTAGREGRGTLVLRGLEFGAAGLVLLLGAGLLCGYLVAERATCL